MTGTIPTQQYATPVIERFWAKVDKSGDCWLWTASTRKGYGQLNVGNKRIKCAHIISYELHNGPVPEGLEIDHECRVPRCVNPKHLRATTHKQNLENIAANRGSKSGVRGASWDTHRGLWAVHVCHGGKRHFGGRFESLAIASAVARELRNELYTHNTLDRRT